jgi:predicted ATPase/class 3 adenylate cyclase
MTPGLDLPTGTVTFLFTDIEGSTRLLQELGEGYREVQDQHAEIVRKAIAEGDGIEVRTEGDSFFAVFQSAVGAVRAAVAAQRGMAAHAWSHDAPLLVRIGIHTGEGVLGGDDYLGIDVNRAARIAAAGHGGQVLLSDATRGLVHHSLPDGTRIRDLGHHRLKDLSQPEQLFDLEIAGVASDFPPPRTVDARPNNLPPQLTSFVGRRRELEDLMALLESERLVTLVGPGGTGKTRLAIETAHRAMHGYADGAWFVDLAPVVDPALVPTATVAALGLAEELDRTPVETLQHQLAPWQALIVFDNFEHVTAAADTVDGLLREAPGLHVLVTSRQGLHLYGEHELAIPPLSVPDAADDLDPDVVSGFDSVALFRDRARAVRRDFEVTAENAGAVTRICERLDGLPLAIELAAARMRLLAPQEILERLEQRLPALGRGASNVPERQRTLRGTIVWSYDLLDDTERAVFARLSVFSGGASIEAAEAIVAADAEDGLLAIESLVDKSLLRAVEIETETRITMLQTILEFASERLAESFDQADTRRRHAEWFVRFVEQAEPHLTAQDQAEWLERCDREHDNLRSALRFLISSGDATSAFRTCKAIWRYWQQRGHLREGSRWAEEALALPGSRDIARFEGHTAAGNLAYWRANLEETEHHYGAALEIARELGDRRIEMRALHNYSFVSVVAGKDSEALPYQEQALEIARELGDTTLIPRITTDIGWIYMMSGRAAEGIPLLEESMSLWRELGDRWNEIDITVSLGQAHRLAGEPDAARRLLREALEMLGESGDVALVIPAVEISAGLASEASSHETAVRLVGAGAALREAIGGGPPPHASRIADVVPNAREVLGDAEVDRLLDEGSKLDVAAARHLALQEAVRDR